jgi:tetratricopeptide (TPR) repeat protein
MNEAELRRGVSDYEGLFYAFEELLKVRDKFYVADDRLATALCELYATMGAYQILTWMGPTNFGVAHNREEDASGVCAPLPKLDTIQKAGRELLAALSSGDGAVAVGSLTDMGLFALCPSLKSVFARMEFITDRVTGHAQQVFVVELARFAANLGDYERAGKYVQQARTFDPSSWELYNIHVVEGLIALNIGNVDEAIRCLVLSTSACLAYEKARAQCCIRAPSLALAEKLLDRGEREAVQRHLLDCRNVWEVLQPWIDNWVQVIEQGGKPNFQAEGNLRVPEESSNRLRMQWMNACSLAGGPVSAKVKSIPPKSRAERRAKREQWMAQNPHLIDVLAERMIADLEKDFVTPPNRPSANPPESGKPE